MVSLLVIDDEPSVLEALEMILTDVGYQVQATISSNTALESLQVPEQPPPDLIITDIVMPEMTGIELFDAVRANDHLSEIPFLFISALCTPEIESLVATHDKTAFLKKPFEVTELFREINLIRGIPPP